MICYAPLIQRPEAPPAAADVKRLKDIIRDMSEEEAARLLSLLDASVSAIRVPPEGCAVLYSGGLDSSTVAALCARLMPVTLYSVGTAGSHDILASVAGAGEMKLNLVSVIAGEEEIKSSAEQVAGLLAEVRGWTMNRQDISIYAPMFHLMGFVKERHVFTGQGADELFGGYSRYMRMGAEERVIAMGSDVKSLLSYGIRRDESVALHFGKELHLPFLSPEVVGFASSLSPESKVDGKTRKKVLRECASLLNLKASSAEKKAMQYGSGFDRVLRHARQSVL